MPFQDIIQSHFTAAEQTSFDALMTQLEALVQSKLHNLNEEENQKYGVINEQHKLFVNKVKDYRNAQPALSSPDVDWLEFAADGADRPFLENGSLRLEALSKAMTETKRLHDYDNYQNSLLDYSYTKYKNETQPGSGYDAKAAELKQFFINPGGSPIPPPPAPASISITTDQNLPSMLNVNVTGNSFSTTAELVITWLLGVFNSAVPANGALINFQYLYTVAGIYTFTITGLLTAIGTLQIAGANLTSILIPAGLHIANLDLSNNKLDLDRVNGVIIALDGNGILNGTLNLSGGTNAAPTGAGLTAKNNLIAKGWTVTTN